MDKRLVRDRAQLDPEAFLTGRKRPFTIDECQLAPELFPALKEWVRLHPGKGQFILTGSVRFTSRRAIRESLTGRIVNLELLPLSPAESHSENLPGWLPELVSSRSLPELTAAPVSWLTKWSGRFAEFLARGGLPGICFFREGHVRAARFETQLETLLERDIRLLLRTDVSYRQLRALLRELALKQGQPLNLQELARTGGVSAPTVKKLLAAMEGMFLLRSFATEKQARPVVFLEDQGMATHLAAGESTPESDLMRGLFSCILPQFLYRPETAPVFYQYRTRGGARVDIAIRTSVGRLGIIPVRGDGPAASALASARSFIADSVGAKAVIAHSGSKVSRVGESIMAVPYPMLLSDGWR
ncbi:MAG: AAA family ATPase [Oligoflexia bacterium]|nr:AAA family ATPase [Oligoflexia bacterium]